MTVWHSGKRCCVCGKLVHDKPLFGTLHICLTDDEERQQRTAVVQMYNQRFGRLPRNNLANRLTQRI